MFYTNLNTLFEYFNLEKQQLLDIEDPAIVEWKQGKKKPKTKQLNSLTGAEDLVETDLGIGQIEDRFIQAGVIESATSLAEKDEVFWEQADATLAATLLAGFIILTFFWRLWRGRRSRRRRS